MSRYFGIGFVCCFVALGAARADEVADMRQCADIEDDASRLACYDRSLDRQAAADKPDDIRPVDVAEESPPVAVEVVEETVPTAEPAMKTAEATVVAKALDAPPEPEQSSPAAAAEAPPDPVENFGLPEVPVKEESKARSGEITAVVAEVTRRPLGEHVVVLENGQVWQQQEATSYFPVKPADTVTIKERRFNGYLLVTSSGRGYGVRRVR